MPTKNMKFEQSMERLDEIVSELEKNEKPLDESIRLFEEGLKLVKSCNDRLKDFEKQVQTIIDENSEEDHEN